MPFDCDSVIDFDDHIVTLCRSSLLDISWPRTNRCATIWRPTRVRGVVPGPKNAVEDGAWAWSLFLSFGLVPFGPRTLLLCTECSTASENGRRSIIVYWRCIWCCAHSRVTTAAFSKQRHPRSCPELCSTCLQAILAVSIHCAVYPTSCANNLEPHYILILHYSVCPFG